MKLFITWPDEPKHCSTAAIRWLFISSIAKSYQMQKLEKSISQATVAKSDDNFSKIQGYLDQVISVTEMIK